MVTERLPSRPLERCICVLVTIAGRYAALVKTLQGMPDETVIDVEVVALDKEGRPSFKCYPNNFQQW